jgi:hypothetical protein
LHKFPSFNAVHTKPHFAALRGVLLAWMAAHRHHAREQTMTRSLFDAVRVTLAATVAHGETFTDTRQGLGQLPCRRRNSIQHREASRRLGSEAHQGCYYDAFAGIRLRPAARSSNGKQMTVAVHSNKAIQKLLLAGDEGVLINKPPVALVECQRSFSVHNGIIGTVPA